MVLLGIVLSGAGITEKLLLTAREDQARAAVDAAATKNETIMKDEQLSQLKAQNDKLENQLNVIEKLLAASKGPGSASAGKSGGSSTVICHVLGGAGTWTLPGQIYLTVDGKKAGFFTVGSEGSTSLDFPCTPGVNTAIMTFVQPPEAKQDPVGCALTLSVGVEKNFFIPGFMKNGSTAQCHLKPANSGAAAK